jgi:adenylate kinase family enzyme
MLLIGPTGVGKTPFGARLEKNGFGGNRCVHFDFGNELRTVAHHDVPSEGFSRREHAFIRDVLEKGLLLENEHFPIAEKVIDAFLLRSGFGRHDILVLNGLPRHVDQARDIDRKMEITSLIVFDCTAEDIFQRIRHNTGGDRLGRPDDGIEMVRKKLEIFQARTTPLVSYYAKAGMDVFRIGVTHSSTAGDLYADFLSIAYKPPV